MHQALYRKWRPSDFDQVYGQDHVTSVLKYQVANSALSHAYLFCGSRGTGKTSCAKILAKAVNCEAPVNGNPCGKCASCLAIANNTATDVIEMDAASNNGVDDVRDIRDEVMYTPSMLKYRVYIIDEVHMLSASAFNALLKTLEEPPAHVIFILATTELQKLPATIISRCQRFEFRRIPVEVLTDRLMYIANSEKIQIERDAAIRIARYAQGGFRDAISLLELCSGTGKQVTVGSVDQSIGSAGRESMIKTAHAIAAKDYQTVFEEIDATVRSSRDVSVFWQDLISLYRDMLIVKTVKDPAKYLDLTDVEAKQLSALSGEFPRETLLSHIKIMDEAYFSMQRSASMKRIIAEMTLVRMCDETLSTSNDTLLSRIAKLEDSIAALKRGGVTVSHAVKEETAAPEPAVNTEEKVPAEPESPASAGKVPEKTQKVQSAPASDNGKRVLRPLRGWSEVIERIGESNQMISSIFGSAKAYTAEDGKIVIRFETDIMINMIKSYDGVSLLCEVLSVKLDREITVRDILLEVTAADNSGAPIDEIILAAEEE